MVCHRWTLALIVICIPILVTVISAFRVRLPGSSHEVKDVKKNKCEHCEVNDINPDQLVNNYATDNVKQSFDNLKKKVRQQPDLKTRINLFSNEDKSDINKIPDSGKNVKNKKVSFHFDFDGEEDDSKDEDDDDKLSKINKINKDVSSSKTSKESFQKAATAQKPKTIIIAKDNKHLIDLGNKKEHKKDHNKENDNDDDEHLNGDDGNDDDDDGDDDDDDGDDDDDDNDDDDDEDDDDDDEEDKFNSDNKIDSKKVKADQISSQLKANTKENLSSKESFKKGDVIDSKPKIVPTLKPKLLTEKDKKTQTKVNDENDDDDEDGDDDEKVKNSTPKPHSKEPLPKKNVSDGKNKILSDLQPKPTESKIKKTSAELAYKRDGDSEDEDDDDDDDDDDIKLSIKISKQTLEKLKKPLESSVNLKIDDAKDTSKALKHEKEKTRDINKEKPKLQAKQSDISLNNAESKKNDKHVEEHSHDKQKATIAQDKKNMPKPSQDKEIKEPSKKNIIDDKKEIKPQTDIRKKTVKESIEPKPTLAEKLTEIKKIKEAKFAKASDLNLMKKEGTTEELTDKSEIKDAKIQFMTEALRKRNLLQSEFEDLYAFLPTFAPNFSRIHNPECRRHGQILLRQLRGSKLWALNMLDATAKIPSGLLQGNGIQLGDFDQCLAVRARVQLDTGSIVKIQGKYCLAMLDLKAEHPTLETPVYLAQAKNLLKSRIDDPGHFVPRFSTLSWGICVPAPCAPEDVQLIMNDAIKHYKKRLGVSLRVRVDDEDCFVKKDSDLLDWSEYPTLLTLSLYAVVVLLVLFTTCQDYISRRKPESDEENLEDQDGSSPENSDGFLQAFSLYNSLDKLVGPAKKNELACIHGFRAVATIALLTAHKFLPVAAMPYTNRLRISEIVSSPLLSWCRAGWMFTDCFLLISGALMSYGKSKEESVLTKVLSKYFRLTPALLAVVLFYAYIWDNLSMGPMWGLLVTRNADICRDSWWWNVLYVQNYLGFENMCAPQTHQLALDLQLTIVGGVIVWAIQSEIPFSGTIMPLLHLLATYSRYTTYRDHRLTALAYQGVSVSQLYRTGTLSYISAFQRCTSYLIGLSLGMVLKTAKPINKFLRILGWLVCLALWGLVLYAGADSGDLKYRYDVTFAAQYAALAPISVALAFAWLIYAVHNGYCDILKKVLCSRPLLFISRISYALYLVQFIVFLTNTATVKSSQEFTIASLFDIKELSTILLASVILTLLFIIPMQSMPRISFSSKSNDEPQEKETASINEDNENNRDDLEENDDLVKEVPYKKMQPLIAHRELLEEIPEIEVEYEIQRELNDGLEEILEEEDEDLEEEGMERIDDDDLEVIEEEQEEQGGEDFWDDRENIPRSVSRNHDRDIEEWEWTSNDNDRFGAQQYRYHR